MRYKAASSALSVVAVIAMALGWGLYRNSRVAVRYESVSIGASAQDVQRLLGTPFRVEPCGTSFGPPKANCTEYIYRNSFAPLIPEYYSVSFDRSGHVVDKFVYESP
jgi:hypothetical protein